MQHATAHRLSPVHISSSNLWGLDEARCHGQTYTFYFSGCIWKRWAMKFSFDSTLLFFCCQWFKRIKPSIFQIVSSHHFSIGSIVHVEPGGCVQTSCSWLLFLIGQLTVSGENKYKVKTCYSSRNVFTYIVWISFIFYKRESTSIWVPHP